MQVKGDAGDAEGARGAGDAWDAGDGAPPGYGLLDLCGQRE
jgi:hypothetical protein